MKEKVMKYNPFLSFITLKVSAGCM